MIKKNFFKSDAEILNIFVKQFLTVFYIQVLQKEFDRQAASPQFPDTRGIKIVGELESLNPATAKITSVSQEKSIKTCFYTEFERCTTKEWSRFLKSIRTVPSRSQSFSLLPLVMPHYSKTGLSLIRL